jgi:hypothetical protein
MKTGNRGKKMVAVTGNRRKELEAVTGNRGMEMEAVTELMVKLNISGCKAPHISRE